MPIRKAYGPWEAAVTCIKTSSLGVKLLFAAFTQKTRKLAAEQTVLANLTSLVWRRALNSYKDLPSPEGHGWTFSDDGRLQPLLMKKEPAPNGLVIITACHCQTSCRRSSCSCRTIGLSCTEAYTCMADDCHNLNTIQHIVMRTV